MKCWGCEYFKIIQEPLRVGKDIYDLGRAECTNFDLIVDFINHGKLKRLECIDETMGEREQVMGIRQDQCNKVCRIIDDYLSNRPRERDELIVAVRTVFKEADRKTENSSEKPNNCETCKWWEGNTNFCYSKADSDDHACHYEPKDEPQTERSSECI